MGDPFIALTVYVRKPRYSVSKKEQAKQHEREW